MKNTSEAALNRIVKFCLKKHKHCWYKNTKYEIDKQIF